MPTHRFRFTIRGFMILIAAMAVPLAVLPGWLIVLSLVGLAPSVVAVLVSLWLVFRERRRLAAICFWGVSILVNVGYLACCLTPRLILLYMLFVLWVLVLLPAILGPGAAWARLARREGAIRGRSRAAVNACVCVMALFPVATLGTLWPLYLAFYLSRPSLERLADQVAAGQAVTQWRRAGVYSIAESDLDPGSGNVGLFVDPNPSGPSGFLRIRSGLPPYYPGRPFATDMNVELPGGWEYRVED